MSKLTCKHALLAEKQSNSPGMVLCSNDFKKRNMYRQVVYLPSIGAELNVQNRSLEVEVMQDNFSLQVGN